ncbi:MAG: hypothetical protein U5K99_09250 [Anaerolineales bacterium]|nr:hypothetical protein [Anaerolineales bacterium]
MKISNWNCVYCQLGRTVPFINRCQGCIAREEIFAEVRDVLGDPPQKKIDWITFVGSGEPTIHQGLDWMIQ